VKKKLLFLFVCVLLLFLVTALPAAAADKIHYEVVINFHDTTSPAFVFWVNETQWSFKMLRAVPRNATDVRVTETVAFVNSGNLAVFAKAFFQKMTVSYLDPRGGATVIASCDESTCQAYWGEPYPLNNWMGDDPAYWLYPYNPNIGAGMWSADWMVPLLPQPNPGGVTLAGRRGLPAHRRAVGLLVSGGHVRVHGEVSHAARGPVFAPLGTARPRWSRSERRRES